MKSTTFTSYFTVVITIVCTLLLLLSISVGVVEGQNIYPVNNVDKLTTRERTFKLGVTWKEEDPNVENGYIVYSSIYPADKNHNYIRVMNMKGEEVHRWDLGAKRPGLWGYMPTQETTKRYRKDDEKGLIFAISQMPMEEISKPHKFIAWDNDRGGYMQLINFNNEVIWTYKDEYQHHDARLTREGMIAYIANEVCDNELEVAKIVEIACSHRGIPIPLKYPTLYSDVIRIADPITGKLIFNWRAAEHLDPTIDTINFNDPFDEWNHGNTIVPVYENLENQSELTHLLVSFRQISSIIKIDVKTGNFTRLLRSPFISQQHDPTILEDTNTNRILVFDNRYIPNDFVPTTLSTVIEYNLLEKAPYPFFPGVIGPKVEWIYIDTVVDFFSSYISGAQRLPGFTLKDHGVQYTLITEGMKGRIFLVRTIPTEEIHDLTGKKILQNTVIFEFMNPEIAPGVGKEVILGRSSIFRARYVSPSMFSDDQLETMKPKSSSNAA